MHESSRLTERVGEVFRAFLLLGMTSFGGPVAHLGYFRAEFVERRRWISEAAYADLVALCQFLPGPASSQVGFALGWMRAGCAGAIAAWCAFTLPSAILLMAFAWGASMLEGPLIEGMIRGLKITSVAIVAHAVWGMARVLCPDPQRMIIAALAAIAATTIGGSPGQLAAISIGAMAGIVWFRKQSEFTPLGERFAVSTRAGYGAGLAFVVLLVGLPLLANVSQVTLVDLMDSFYRAGSLVFGGGHVVLPLLEAEVVRSGWVGADEFLAGYGAAQAVPGPLFSFAAYLGVAMDPSDGAFWRAPLALVMIFLPGLLLLTAVLPHWDRFRRLQSAQALTRGANAAVVGILAGALCGPVWTGAIHSPVDGMLAVTGFTLLSVWKFPAWLVVALLAGVGGLLRISGIYFN